MNTRTVRYPYRSFSILLAALLLAGLALTAPLPQPAQATGGVNTNLWSTDGPVYSTLLSGNILYIGGDFTHVGPAVHNFGAVDKLSGEPDLGWPSISAMPGNDDVFSIVPDGRGGW